MRHKAPNMRIIPVLYVLVAMFGFSCSDKLDTGPDCLKDADCSGKTVCRSGVCISVVSECREDDECTDGEICLSGQCRDALCETDCDCTTGRSCQSGRCLLDSDVCENDEDCEDGEICQIDDLETCNRGRCDVKQCQNSDDCPDGELCFDGSCRESDCMWTLDCGSDDQFCRDLLCQSLTCVNHWDCEESQVCRQGTCETIECSARRCPMNSACSPEGICLYEGCIVRSDCSQPEAICYNKACLSPECEDDDDCLPLERCRSGLCTLLP